MMERPSELDETLAGKALPLDEARPSALPDILPGLFPGAPSWQSHFGREAPRVAELGFGRPHFLCELAAELPDHDVIGIEWKARHVSMAQARAQREGLRNVCAVHGNAWMLFGSFFAPESLVGIHLNFPDPWWKSKHRKRRIVSEPFARLLASRLKPGGRLLIQTDVASMLEEYLERLEMEPTLQNPYGAGRLCSDKPVRARSHREQKCREAGIPIFRALLIKAESDS